MTARINPYILLSVLLLAFLVSGLAKNAHSATFTANAVVLSKNQCRFLSNNVTLALTDYLAGILNCEFDFSVFVPI